MERSSGYDLILAGTLAVLLHAALALWQISGPRSMHEQEASLTKAITINLVAKRPAAVVIPTQGIRQAPPQKESRPVPQPQKSPRRQETPKPETPAPVSAAAPRESTLLAPAPTTPSASEESSASGISEVSSSLAVPGRQTASPPAFVESRPPAYGQRLDPEYPELARRRGYQGTALLRVRVLEDGRVEAVQVKESSGYLILDSTATKAVWTWRFTPALAEGKPAASWVLVPITFKLE